MPPMVGQILLEDHDGNVVTLATYTQHPLLRAPDLRFQGIWYQQNRQTPGGQWVYRAVGTVPGSIGTDPLLKVE